MSNPSTANDILERLPAQVATVGDGRLLIRGPSGVSLLNGIDLADLERVLDQVDGQRSAKDICLELVEEYEADAVLHLLRHLTGSIVRPVSHLDETATLEPSLEPTETEPQPPGGIGVLVLGDGIAGRRLAELLAARRLATLPERDALDQHLQSVDLVVCALEDTPYSTLFQIQEACLRAAVTSLFVTFDPDGVRVGPSVVPSVGPCFGCAQVPNFRASRLPIEQLIAAISRFRTSQAKAITFESTAREVAREARSLLAAIGSRISHPSLLSSVLLLSRAGHRTTYSAAPDPGCPLCSSTASSAADADHPLAGRVRQELIDSDRNAPRQATVTDSTDLCTSIGILGGGTAGYLTALALRRKLPALDITLIESSSVPIIGVGEATTPLMPQFLHVDLGLDVHELFREVAPTFKLGLHFDWGPPGEGFNYPFGPVHVLEPAVYDGNILRCSPQSLLMTAGAVPVEGEAESEAEGGGSRWRSALDVDTAYHLDNARFVAYLRRQASKAGITTLDARIVDVEAEGDFVKALKTDDGRTFRFDLYVDCSGFRSLLLKQSLGSPFLSYANSLFTDRALVATVPHGGVVQPYTSAETLSAGWCWSTPQRREDHRGYVFCSAFANPEDAERELRHHHPGLSDPRLIEFQAGRHEHFFKGNVVAMGNAYGFVEPLESTALHMLIRQIGLLAGAFPLRRDERGIATLLNRQVGAYWDYLQWFLAIHYRFNRRLDSPFWRHCRRQVDVSAHGELIEAFRERGPLSYQPAIRNGFPYPDPLWGPEGVDVLLLGQQVPSRLPRPRVDLASWQQRAARGQRQAERAIPQAEALAIIDKEPQILDDWVSALRRFGPAFGGAPSP